MTSDHPAAEGQPQGGGGTFRRGARTVQVSSTPAAPPEIESAPPAEADVLESPIAPSSVTTVPPISAGELTTAQPLVPPAPPGTVVPAVPGGTAVQRGPRKARLQVRQVDPWSVMKLGFLLSMALGIVFVVAVGLLWSLLDSGGVFDSINKVVADVANTQTDFTVQGSLAFRRVMGVALVLAVVQVVLNTALATLGAFLYNLAAGLVGGLDVTLVEES